MDKRTQNHESDDPTRALQPSFNNSLSKLLIFLSITLQLTQATINLADMHHDYKSQPAAFGMHFDEAREYLARLQSLENEDPYLCDWDHKRNSSKAIVVPEDGLAVALLTRNGQCSFEHKARLAQALHPVIRYLIVYDDNPVNHNLVKMTADDPDGITLGLQYVGFASGKDLLLRISRENGNHTNQGVRIYMDSYTEWDDIVRFLTWILLLLTCGMVGIFLYLNRWSIAPSPEWNANGTIARSHERLLTREEITHLQEVRYWNDDDRSPKASSATTDLSSVVSAASFEHYSVCSICLEDFIEGERIRILPKCHHYFHSDCIIPWLSMRHPTCPLCKSNVKEDLRELLEEGLLDEDEVVDEVHGRSRCRLCCCCRRRNRVEIEIDIDDDHDSVVEISSLSSHSLTTPLLEDNSENGRRNQRVQVEIFTDSDDDSLDDVEVSSLSSHSRTTPLLERDFETCE